MFTSPVTFIWVSLSSGKRMSRITSAGGIIAAKFGEEIRILFIHGRAGLSFPKGKVEEGERIEDAAEREMMEELGLESVEIGAKLGVVTRESTERDGTTNLKDIHLFLAKALGGHIDEHEEEYDWFTIDDALTQMNYEIEADFLRQHRAAIEQNLSTIQH